MATNLRAGYRIRTGRRVPRRSLKQTWEILKEAVSASMIGAIFKPSRTLGGTFMGDRVALEKDVRLCEPCVRKYGKWFKKEGYRPCWDHRWLGDCHGSCGGRTLYVYMFLPEETFFDSLERDTHGIVHKRPF